MDTGRLYKIVHHFPLRGQSFLDNDQNFSVMRNAIRRCSRIYTMYELCTLICNAFRGGQNTFKHIDNRNVIDFAMSLPHV